MRKDERAISTDNPLLRPAQTVVERIVVGCGAVGRRAARPPTARHLGGAKFRTALAGPSVTLTDHPAQRKSQSDSARLERPRA